MSYLPKPCKLHAGSSRQVGSFNDDLGPVTLSEPQRLVGSFQSKDDPEKDPDGETAQRPTGPPTPGSAPAS